MKVKKVKTGWLLMISLIVVAAISSCFLIPENAKEVKTRIKAITPVCQVDFDFSVMRDLSSDNAIKKLEVAKIPADCKIIADLTCGRFICPNLDDLINLLINQKHNCKQIEQKGGINESKDEEQSDDHHEEAVSMDDAVNQH